MHRPATDRDTEADPYRINPATYDVGAVAPIGARIRLDIGMADGSAPIHHDRARRHDGALPTRHERALGDGVLRGAMTHRTVV